MQIFVRSLVGKLNAYEVTPQTTAGELTAMVKEREGFSTGVYLVHQGKVISEPISADKQLADFNIQQGTTVSFLLRMLGGGRFVDKDTLYELICDGLDTAIAKLPDTVNDCDICLDEGVHCISACHMKYCSSCFITGLKTSSFTLKCMQCQKVTSVEGLVPSLTPFVNEYREVCELLKNIDVQLCDCGALIVNPTLDSCATCQVCKRTFCFFCNKTWATKMVNQKYSCGVNCENHNPFTYSLVDLAYSTGGTVKIPNMRFCPKCCEQGAYDMKCKYHKCKCGYSFCFLCLRPEEDCKKTSSYGTKCDVPLAVQTYDMFPRLLPV